MSDELTLSLLGRRERWVSSLSLSLRLRGLANRSFSSDGPLLGAMAGDSPSRKLTMAIEVGILGGLREWTATLLRHRCKRGRKERKESLKVAARSLTGSETSSSERKDGPGTCNAASSFSGGGEPGCNDRRR